MCYVRFQNKWVKKKDVEKALPEVKLIYLGKQFLYLMLGVLFAAWSMSCDKVVYMKHCEIYKKRDAVTTALGAPEV